MDTIRDKSNRFFHSWRKLLSRHRLRRRAGLQRRQPLFSNILDMAAGFHCLPFLYGKRRIAVAIAFSALLFTTYVQAAQVTLAWDANNPTPDGYRVFQRLDGASYDYSSPVWPQAGDDATQTTCTIAGLADNTTYHYVVRAYVGGVESGDSNEATYQSGPPVVSTFTLTATAGANGSISPGTVTVNSGGSQTFTMVPATSYHVADVVVDGSSVGARSTFTFSNVNQDHTISANFAPDAADPDTYTITATGGANGTISPSGAVHVDSGASQSFIIAADSGYTIVDLMVDGVSQPIANSYTFRNVTAAHTISVSFASADNQPPVANAGPDQTVDEAVEVTLSGYNSVDNDDGIVSIQWRQMSGPAVQLSATDEAIVTFTAPDVDSNGAALEFELTVTDASGASAADSCIVNVSWVNEAPTADAGNDQTVTAGASVSLTAEGSSDPDNGIAGYEWQQLKGPAVALDDSTAASPGFTAPGVDLQGASLVFQLTVTDAGGLQDTDNCTVTVVAQNNAPLADAGPDQQSAPGSQVTLDGSNSSDPEGSDLTYHWRQTDGYPMALSDPMAVAPVFVVPDEPDAIDQAVPGSSSGNVLVFELTVTDSGGLSSADTCVVMVNPAGQAEDKQPPELKILDPSRSRIFIRRSTISISGTATDNQQVDRVVWEDNRGNSGVADGAEQWRINNLPLRRWRNTVTITAYDSAGNSQIQTLTIYAFY